RRRGPRVGRGLGRREQGERHGFARRALDARDAQDRGVGPGPDLRLVGSAALDGPVPVPAHEPRRVLVAGAHEQKALRRAAVRGRPDELVARVDEHLAAGVRAVDEARTAARLPDGHVELDGAAGLVLRGAGRERQLERRGRAVLGRSGGVGRGRRRLPLLGDGVGVAERHDGGHDDLPEQDEPDDEGGEQEERDETAPQQGPAGGPAAGPGARAAAGPGGAVGPRRAHGSSVVVVLVVAHGIRGGARLGRCRADDGPGRGRMARAPAPPPLPRGAARPPRGRPSPMTAVRPARTAAAPSSAAASPDATSPGVASPDPATPDAYAGLRDAVGRWFAETARDLPWRAADRTAWGVLVSEVMLQQTPVVRVEPVWRAWMDRWPEPADLAAAPTADVLRAWGRLGYPRRALRLQECAR